MLTSSPDDDASRGGIGQRPLFHSVEELRERPTFHRRRSTCAGPRLRVVILADDACYCAFHIRDGPYACAGQWTPDSFEAHICTCISNCFHRIDSLKPRATLPRREADALR